MDRQSSGPLRVESFSDSVFSVAITLLSLELRVPHEPGVSLAQGLLDLWPEYVAFVLSFCTVGAVWLNHRRLFGLLQRADHGLLLWNGLLLMAVCVVPFSYRILSEYLDHPGARTAAVLYSATFVAIASIYSLLWRHAASPNSKLLKDSASPAVVRLLRLRYRRAVFLYAISLVIGFLSAITSVVTDLLFAVYFAWPIPDLDRPPREGAHPFLRWRRG